MTLYSIALFVHVVGAVLVFAALTVEGVALRQVRGATLVLEAAAGARLLRLNRVVGPFAAASILVPGLYMTATSWGWTPWIVTSLTAYAVIAGLGAFSGVSLGSLEVAPAGEAGPVTPSLHVRLRSARLPVSWLVRVGIATGVIFLMVVKPGWEGSLAALLASSGAGLAVAAVSLSGVGRPGRVTGRTR